MDEPAILPPRRRRTLVVVVAVLTLSTVAFHALVVPDGSWGERLALGTYVGVCWVLGAWLYDTGYTWRVRRLRRRS